MTPLDARRARERERSRLTLRRMDLDRRLKYERPMDQATRCRLTEEVNELDRRIAEVDGVSRDAAEVPEWARRRRPSEEPER